MDRIDDLISKLGYEGAASVVTSESVDNLDYVYLAGDLYRRYIESVCLDEKELLKKYKYRFTSEFYSFVLSNYDILSSYIVRDRSTGYKYSSIKDIASNYLMKQGSSILEDIQWMWMRVAVQVAMPNLDDIRDTYDILSTRKAIHATPTCVNAGIRCNNEDRSQMESCFLISIGDSMSSIANTQKLFLMGSKNNGGFGVDISRIRHSQVSNRGITKGVPGLLNIWNTIVPYADQLGSRPGAATFFLSIHHKDIETFIKMKDKNSSIQATNLNYAVSIPDLFMKRVESNMKWSLFCPRDEKRLWVRLHGGDCNISDDVDKAPCLSDLHGEDFNTFYMKYEESDIVYKTVDARDLWMKICTLRSTIGSPFIFFKDNVNRKSNHQHLGTITQSNLCMEIVQYTKPEEIAASCDLATINLPEFVRGDDIDWYSLGRITRLLTRNLNRVIDRTSGILPRSESIDPSRTGCLTHRAIGIGVMGFASMLSLMEIEYGSSRSIDIGTRIRACIYYHSMDESVSLAERDGKCQSWYGSPLSKGILHPDMYEMECISENRRRYVSVEPSSFGIDATWDMLRQRVKRGTRNSLTTCQMPNSTTSSVIGVSPGVEPFFDILYSSSNINGSRMDIYDSFKTVMMRYNLYDPVLLAHHLKENKGSISKLETVYDPVYRDTILRIKSFFKNGFTVNKKKMLQLYQSMGVYVDQAQSTNIFYDRPNAEYLSQLQMDAWKDGCKTLYYVHRKTTDKISLQSSKKEPEVCTADCRSCQ